MAAPTAAAGAKALPKDAAVTAPTGADRVTTPTCTDQNGVMGLPQPIRRHIHAQQTRALSQGYPLLATIHPRTPRQKTAENPSILV